MTALVLTDGRYQNRKMHDALQDSYARFCDLLTMAEEYLGLGIFRLQLGLHRLPLAMHSRPRWSFRISPA